MAHRHQLPPQQSFYPPTYSASPTSWGQHNQPQPPPPPPPPAPAPATATAAAQDQSATGYAPSTDSDYAHHLAGLPVGDSNNNNNNNNLDEEQYSDSPGPNTRGSAAGGGTLNGPDDGPDGLDGSGGEKKKPTRGARACLHCRRLKVSRLASRSARDRLPPPLPQALTCFP